LDTPYHASAEIHYARRACAVTLNTINMCENKHFFGEGMLLINILSLKTCFSVFVATFTNTMQCNNIMKDLPIFFESSHSESSSVTVMTNTSVRCLRSSFCKSHYHHHATSNYSQIKEKNSPRKCRDTCRVRRPPPLPPSPPLGRWPWAPRWARRRRPARSSCPAARTKSPAAPFSQNANFRKNQCHFLSITHLALLRVFDADAGGPAPESVPVVDARRVGLLLDHRGGRSRVGRRKSKVRREERERARTL
jgi:hypothetical protein